MHRHNRHGVGNIDLEIDDNDNYINIDYVERNNNGNDEKISSNLGKINTNKNDVSNSLIRINNNEDDILYNLNEIDYLKKISLLNI